MKYCPICETQYDESEDFCDIHMNIRLIEAISQLKPPTCITLQHSSDGSKLIIKKSCTLGREITDELEKYNDISRKHCELLLKEDGIYVRDLGSKNKTYVNDNELLEGDEVKLFPMDKLRLGMQPFRVIKIDQ
ncbi:MAG: FHA domain-containing protein [Leptospiraceae bacterium]|nr:FHA domain-containing protein [Leptospiraceae bacterium]MCP5494245.1 FHA domain-containing protein [Leptospiraceae bacterium]